MGTVRVLAGTTTNLYLLNTALLFTHEIDSAFWKEWDLFGIPGGIQVFLVLNFLLLLIALYGFEQLVRGAAAGLYFSLLLSAAGILAFGIHAFFLLAGHPEFTLPASLAVLVLTLIVSLIQGSLALRAWRNRPEANSNRILALFQRESNREGL